MNALISWAIAHPEQLPVALAATATLARLLYALLSRLVQPYPRLRALVEALAAASPDVIRAAQQLASAVLGRPVPTLDARAPDDDREALRVEVTRLRARVADLMGDRVAERDTVVPAPIPPRNGQSGRSELGALVAALAVVGAGVALSACPNWNRPACPRAGVHSCERNWPHYCAPTGELTPIGDESCDPQGRVCEVLDGGAGARCGRADAAVSDGGTE